MSGWGAVAGFFGDVIGRGVTDAYDRYQTKWNNSQTLDMYRATPSAQMEGYQRAGLNPMLAYQNTSFEGSKMVQGAQISSSGATSAYQAGTQSKQTESNVKKIAQEIENLKTDQQRAAALIDVAREQYQNLVKEGYNITEIGNQISANINKIRSEVDVNVQRRLNDEISYELQKIELGAARKFDAIGADTRQLKPLIDILKSIFLRK